MPNLVATVGGANSNSFVTEDEAEAYLDNRLNASAWVVGSDNSQRALIEATREISLLKFAGDRTDETQALSWPRKFAVDPDYPRHAGVDYTDIGLTYFADNVVPTRVKDATIELALAFVKAGTSDLATIDSTDNVIRKKVGPLETEYSAPQDRVRGVFRFPRVVALLEPLLATEASVGGLTIVRE